MKLYKYNINEMTGCVYEKYLGMMTKEKQSRISRKQIHRDRIRSVCAEMLARRAISATCNIAEKDIVIKEEENGKPYAEGIDIHFSLSHSADYAVCAVSKSPVGIDIEKIRPINARVAMRTFTDSELRYLLGHEPEKQGLVPELSGDCLVRFYEIWTAKEAYGKMRGDGIRLTDSIDTTSLTSVKREYFDGYVVSIVT